MYICLQARIAVPGMKFSIKKSIYGIPYLDKSIKYWDEILGSHLLAQDDPQLVYT